MRLKVPPGTSGLAQQDWLDEGPQFAASPWQLGGWPHAPAEQCGVAVGHCEIVHCPPLQACSEFPSHVDWPGAHSPPQAAFVPDATQVWLDVVQS